MPQATCTGRRAQGVPRTVTAVHFSSCRPPSQEDGFLSSFIVSDLKTTRPTEVTRIPVLCSIEKVIFTGPPKREGRALALFSSFRPTPVVRGPRVFCITLES